LLENLSGVFAMKLPENNFEGKYKQVTAEIRILFKPGRKFNEPCDWIVVKKY